jgi:DNA polymerase-3 subunit chi
MTKAINLYQTSKENLYKSACLLLAKCYKEELKTIVLTKDDNSAQSFDNLLWSFSQKSFIPHALISDQLFEEHPIIVSSSELETKDFEGLVLIENFSANIANFKKIFLFFTEENKARATSFQNLADFKEANYYIQQPKGEWVRSSI